MQTSAELQEQTILDLFHRLEHAEIRYALLRNFENFPRFGHDVDLILHQDDLPHWRNIAKEVAQNNHWDHVTECAHWAQSGSSFHNIQVFRFYGKNPLTFLQVDIFHGSLLWALPLYTEKQILAGRIHEDQHGFHKINPLIEHINHFLQIQKMLTYTDITAELFGTESKTERYRKKILAYHNEHSHDFETELTTLFSRHGLQALQALKSEKMLRFAEAIKQGKRHFFFRFLCHHPLQTLGLLWNRVRYQIYSGRLKPCGFLLKATATTDEEKQRVHDALQLLMDANVLIGFSVKWAEEPRLNKQERCIIERSGIVVKWCSHYSHDKNARVISNYKDPQTLAETILEQLIQRHELL